MDRATVSRIEGWDARTVAGGHAGLADLAAAEFTGAVEAAGTYLFVLNGRIVGVVGGSISDFEGADATAYAAPDPALPLLFAMRERGGEVKGRYYTDDTPIPEVDETLSEAGFTGYLELSENVLSGDYYVVYYGGRSLSAAFVGNRERVVTGEEAFDLAADEVGIYEVRSVDLEVTDVPEPPEDASAGGASAGAATSGGSTDDVSGSVDDGEAGADAEARAEEEPGAEPEAGADAGPSTDEEGEDRGRPDDDGEEPVRAEGATTDDGGDRADADGGGDDVRRPADADDDRRSPDPESDGWAGVGAGAADDETVEGSELDGSGADAATATEAEGVDGDDDLAGGTDWDGSGEPAVADDAEILTDEPADEPTGTPEVGASTGEPRGEEPTEREAGTSRRESPAVEQPADEPESNERFRDEARWREARTVPALDPEETELPAEPSVSEDTAAEPEAGETRDEAAGEPGDREVEALRERVQELEEALEATEKDRRRQAERVESLAEERDELLSERTALQERIDELEARIEAQESQIEEQAAAAGSTGGHRREPDAESVDPASALDRTDVFVRYGSQGKATLETAHDGRAGRDEVAENLRLETHNRFDADDVTVEGRPFEEYLADTIEYRFVSWLIEELLYELQETGNERALGGVYDALPAIDRAEFGGAVAVDEGEGEEERETFDVVCRDRMGKPLLVANINDSLDPATGEMMAALVEDATAAAEAHESIGAAFVVTASFFEPAALETASEATGGGFLSRDSKKSFVKLSRKGGYHLCLVEARAGDFHVAVPEL